MIKIILEIWWYLAGIERTPERRAIVRNRKIREKAEVKAWRKLPPHEKNMWTPASIKRWNMKGPGW